MFLKRFSILLTVLFTLTFFYNGECKDYSSALFLVLPDSSDQDTILTQEYIEFNPEIELSKLRKSLYMVSVSNFYNANEFTDILKEKGYMADVYRWEKTQDFSTLEDHSAIWLGYNVPADLAVEVIFLAVNFYPHLKYIHITGDEKGEPPPKDVHNSVYIGGTTSTAEKLGLKPLTYEDFMKIDSSMTKEELHKYVKKFY